MQDLSGAIPPNRNLSFENALASLKIGLKVGRAGWNGKGMFLYHVPDNRYDPVTEIGKDIAFATTPQGQESDGKVPYGAYIAMKTVQNNVVPWLASQTDLLSDDWEIIP